MNKDEIAYRRWMAIPVHTRKKLEGNVFCRNCGVTTIVDYIVDSENHKIVLVGKCEKCGGRVARLID
ncbi:hypothetical protein FGG79_15205 [Bacillus sp. BHET2]|uniref:hypothetical protein n=1 Tax=Bacillus sp. BHET2 TaxID=2583818 RepID=UPI00110E6E69|nr:hypothetical protein [Bacillus sp. BHET2]TMU84242.1 hypothetical protein FGG79_15205 [Bacillus sp. BHET2]